MMSGVLELMVLGLAVSGGMMVLVWLVSLVTRDAGIIDPFWGLGFVLLVWAYHLATPAATGRSLLVAVLVSVWGLRLFGYLLWRWQREPEEDYRYREMREKHGERFPLRSLFTVFLLQAGLQVALSAPLLQVQRSPGPRGWTGWDAVALGLFAAGLFFEAVGDWQLARFKADPSNEGEVMDRGLWRYTRHPNYFGDAMVWWGLALFALAIPGSWWVLYSPVGMTLLLMKVSGVPLLEDRLEEKRPGYREYVRRTNAFFPGFPSEED